MTEITWTISQLDRKPVDGELADVCVTAHWRCTGIHEANGKVHSGTVYATCALPPPVDGFTPYEQITEQQVLNWIWTSGVDKDATEAAVQAQIDLQLNPPAISGTPWAQPLVPPQFTTV